MVRRTAYVSDSFQDLGFRAQGLGATSRTQKIFNFFELSRVVGLGGFRGLSLGLSVEAFSFFCFAGFWRCFRA